MSYSIKLENFLDLQTNKHKKLSYRRETARQLHTSKIVVFSVHSLIVHFTEHRICFTTIIID